MQFWILPSYVLLRGTFCVIITLTRSNSSTVLVSSSYKTLLEILLNPGLNLTIFRGTGPWLLLLTLFKLSEVNFPKRALMNLTYHPVICRSP